MEWAGLLSLLTIPAVIVLWLFLAVIAALSA
jgi:hypothetical protein